MKGAEAGLSLAVCVVCAVSTSAVGCAAQARYPEPSAPPPPAVVAAPPPPPGASAEQAAAAPASVAPAAPPSGKEGQPFLDQGLDSRVASEARALGEVATAEREVAASLGSCRTACRALGSMDSAAGRLCGLASSPVERRDCEESKAKVLAARARVAASCGTCPGGTSLDPRAPVPSSP